MEASTVGSAWTDLENARTVDTYFEMLRAELAGEVLNKSQFNRNLQEAIGRSMGAIEFKHANISAVLHQLRSFYINGYKPRSNVQKSLRLEVERRLRVDSEVEALMLKAVDEPVNMPGVDFLLRQSVAPVIEMTDRIYHRQAVKHDFVQLEASKRELGLAGELAVINFEKARLRRAGMANLANEVEHISVTQGDGLGFDILSFDSTGAERLIEVKTTRRAESWPFVATRNEVSLSTEVPEKFHLYRVFGFGKSTPGLFTLPGSLEESCSLVPRDFDAYPA
ncbi:DUF3883 domain-containing protein [Specibacter sp. NPDC078692]|uniref:DUF3883 domain-containing protein n=1 Tax=Specibacter sp. NPDC078692 TaxID=3155818 RepID=UPI003421286B